MKEQIEKRLAGLETKRGALKQEISTIQQAAALKAGELMKINGAIDELKTLLIEAGKDGAE